MSRDEASTVPALLRCDGCYVMDGFDGGSFRPGWAEAAVKLTAYCGWLRFEGNGGVIMRKNVNAKEQLRGTWQVVGDNAVQLSVPQDPTSITHRPKSLIVEEGDVIDTVLIYVAGAGPRDGVVRFSFVPEEH